MEQPKHLNKTISWACVALIMGIVQPVSASNILVVSTQMSSHMIYLNAVGEGLVQRGHKVYTIVGSQFKDSFLDNIRGKGLQAIRYKTPQGTVTFNSEEYQKQMVNEAINGVVNPVFFSMMFRDCEYMLQDKEMMKQLEGIKIDMAIVDAFVLGPCPFLIPHVLGVPYVSVSSNFKLFDLGVPLLPSISPSTFTDYTDDMDFFQRLRSTWERILTPVVLMALFPGMFNDTLLHKYSRDPALKTWDDLLLKSEIFLYTRGPLLEWPLASMPHVIYVECLTCKEGKPLTGEWEQFYNSASNGVILVTFGSMAGHLPSIINEKFLKTFGMRKESIIWKVDSGIKSALQDRVPPNVKLVTWIPQNDLLAHHKTKIFVTHCGNNGQYESVYHGVPMLGIPLFAEQPHNAFRMEAHGYGKWLHHGTFTPEDFNNALEELITDPAYRERTQKASKIFHHKPLHDRDLAAYWVEHVMEFGSDHLKTPAMTMPWYSYYMVDVLTFSAFVIFVILFLLKVLIKMLCRLICGRKSSSKLKTN